MERRKFLQSFGLLGLASIFATKLLADKPDNLNRFSSYEKDVLLTIDRACIPKGMSVDTWHRQVRDHLKFYYSYSSVKLTPKEMWDLFSENKNQFIKIIDLRKDISKPSSFENFYRKMSFYDDRGRLCDHAGWQNYMSIDRHFDKKEPIDFSNVKL